jgi:IPT/TIG domain
MRNGSGATAATHVTVESDTQITARSPRGVGDVDVRVTTAAGTSAVYVADRFTFLPTTSKPTVESVKPRVGCEDGGDLVAITGTNLTGATAVTFEGRSLTASSSDESRRFFREPRWRRLGWTAFVCYLVVAIFGATYGVVRIAWPQFPASGAAIVGTLAAAPLVVAFVWDRLTGFTLFGVSVTLAQVVVAVDQSLATALSEQQWMSGNDALFRVVDRAIAKPDIEFLEINLRAAAAPMPYWWSTRLYLQAALVDDRTNIQQLVFVDGGSRRRYLGMAAPGAVRRAIAQAHKRDQGVDLDLAYREITDLVRGTKDPQGRNEVRRVIEDWAAHGFTNDVGTPDEEQVMISVSAEQLSDWVVLARNSVESDQPLDSALLQALVLEKGSRFVSLTQAGELRDVVNADAFARQAASKIIRAKLG